MQLNCKVIQKVATPPVQGYPPFLAKFLVVPTPQLTQFLEGPTPTPPLIRGEGFQIWSSRRIFCHFH